MNSKLYNFMSRWYNYSNYACKFLFLFSFRREGHLNIEISIRINICCVVARSLRSTSWPFLRAQEKYTTLDKIGQTLKIFSCCKFFRWTILKLFRSVSVLKYTFPRFSERRLTSFEIPASVSRTFSFSDLDQCIFIWRILGITLVSCPHLK